jgi:predicted choloylglycine hydrolase
MRFSRHRGVVRGGEVDDTEIRRILRHGEDAAERQEAWEASKTVGAGFGIPVVLRYLLQTCATVAEARAVLARLPYQLAHTLTLVDRSGDVVTAYVSPDRGALFCDTRIATNHQGEIEWHEHARATRTLERERAIGAALMESDDPDEFAYAFLRPPIFSHAYASGMGTLYTAVYDVARGAVAYRWPGYTWEHSFDRFRPGIRVVGLVESSAA